MKFPAIGLFFMVFAASACAEKPQQRDAQVIQKTGKSEELDTQRQIIARFEAALETAPVYSSAIRSSLIDDPSAYRASYRNGSAEFAGESEQLSCPHDREVIDALSEAGWQIVKCEYNRVTFFRRHADASDEARRCFDGVVGSKKKDIGDVFETLDVSFQTFYPTSSLNRPSMRNFMWNVSNHLSGKKVQGDRLKPFYPLGDFEGADFFEKDWNSFQRFYGLDEQRERLVQFDLRTSDDCKRNPIGWARTSRHTIKLDSPQSSVRAMNDALSRIVELLAESNA